jgi:hypothetical protein
VFSARKITSMIIEIGLFLTRARDWVKTTETKIKEPRFGRRGVVANKRGVSIASLAHV